MGTKRNHKPSIIMLLITLSLFTITTYLFLTIPLSRIKYFYPITNENGNEIGFHEDMIELSKIINEDLIIQNTQHRFNIALAILKGFLTKLPIYIEKNSPKVNSSKS